MQEPIVDVHSALGPSGVEATDSWRVEVDEIISRINAKEREAWASIRLSPRSETLVLPEAPSDAPPGVDAPPGCALCPTEPAVFSVRCPNPLVLEEAVTAPVHPATQALLCSACADHQEGFDPTLPSAPLARRPSEETSGARRTRNADDVVREVIEASEQVKAELGPALEAPAFRTFLAHELRLRGLSVVEDVAVAASYKGKVVDDAFRVDMLVDGAVIVDVGRTELSQEEHEARLRTLMRGVGAVAGVLVSRQAGDGDGLRTH